VGRTLVVDAVLGAARVSVGVGTLVRVGAGVGVLGFGVTVVRSVAVGEGVLLGAGVAVGRLVAVAGMGVAEGWAVTASSWVALAATATSSGALCHQSVFQPKTNRALAANKSPTNVMTRQGAKPNHRRPSPVVGGTRAAPGRSLGMALSTGVP
jgi:hypothetical protein